MAENIQLQISLLHKSMSIFKAGLSSLSDSWAKYKEVPGSVKKCNKSQNGAVKLANDEL